MLTSVKEAIVLCNQAGLPYDKNLLNEDNNSEEERCGSRNNSYYRWTHHVQASKNQVVKASSCPDRRTCRSGQGRKSYCCNWSLRRNWRNIKVQLCNLSGPCECRQGCTGEGRRKGDKRQVIAERDVQREMQRAIGRQRKGME